jgi:hypothetical protein
MIVVYGASENVTRTKWNGKFVWVAGLNTPWEVVRTYMDICILVVDDVYALPAENLTGVYIINEGGVNVAIEAVCRGAYVLNCSMKEGLWRLRDIINNYK